MLIILPPNRFVVYKHYLEPDTPNFCTYPGFESFAYIILSPYFDWSFQC